METGELEFTFESGPYKGGKPISIRGDHVMLGSDPRADVVVPGPKVLPKHALITLTNKGYELYALSPEDICVNGQPITDSQVLASGDAIRLGDESVLVVRFAGRPVAELPDAMLQKPPRGLLVEVRTPSQRISRKTFRKGLVVVGSSIGADVCVPDDRVSGKHLVIRARQDKYFFYPEGKEPVISGDHAVHSDEQVLPGQRVQIGGHQLLFEILAADGAMGLSGRWEDSQSSLADLLGVTPPPSVAPGTPPTPLPQPSDAATVLLTPANADRPPPMAQLQGIDSRSLTVAWKGEDPFVMMGSDPACDLCFPNDGTIESLHAICAWQGRAHILHDRSEKKLTTVNREGLDGRPRCLEPDDVIFLGTGRALAYARLDPPPHYPEPNPAFTLEVVGGPLRGRTFTFSKPSVTIGSPPHCVLGLDDLDPEGEWLRLDARASFGHVLLTEAEEGITVNGAAARKSHLLHSGDSIALKGVHEFVYKPATPIHGDPGPLDPSAYGVRIWGAGRPSRDVPFAEPALLVGNSQHCDVRLDLRGGKPYPVLLTLDQGSGVKVWCRDPAVTFQVGGEPRLAPFSWRIDERLDLPGGLHLQLFEFKHTSGPTFRPGTLFLLEPLGQPGGARIAFESEKVKVGHTPSCELPLKAPTAGLPQADAVAYLVTLEGRTVLYPKPGHRTTVDGTECPNPVTLENGNVIGFPSGEEFRFFSPGRVSDSKHRSADGGARSAASVNALYFLEPVSSAPADSPAAVVPVNSTKFLVGRSDQCDMIFASPHVSREHFVIALELEEFVLHNISRQGTWVEGARVETRPLHDGDLIKFGDDIQFRFVLPQSPAEDEDFGPGFELGFINGEHADERLEFHRLRVTLGRNQDCDVTFANASVSRRHADIAFRDGRYWLVPLGSTPTTLNGRLVRAETVLEGSANLEIPGSRFVFQELRHENETVPVSLPSEQQPAAPSHDTGPPTGDVGVPFRLRVLEGPWAKGTELPFAQMVVRIGRDPQSDLQVKWQSVSGQQAILSTQAGQVVIENRARTPTLVNGELAEGQVLKPGDRISLVPGIELEFLLGGRAGGETSSGPEKDGPRPWSWLSRLKQ
ncbi:MAG: FHA domain-containing protein [Candidatus Riflebacteria bacterium]|nr:FHA domain-containing protein [Candidatus Riflebacteria bacterium]